MPEKRYTYLNTKTIIKLAFQLGLLLLIYKVLWFYVPLPSFALDADQILFEFVIAAPYIFVSFLLLERPIHIITKLTNYLDSKTLFMDFSVYRSLSAIISIIPFAVIISSLPNMIITGQDPLVARMSITGHWLVWVFLLLLVIKAGWRNIIKGIFAGAFIYATHEADWMISSIAQFSNPIYTGEPFSQGFLGVAHVFFWGYIPLTLTIISILFAYYLKWRVFSTKAEILIILFPALWGIIQLIIQFPNTIAAGNPTPFYNDPVINFVEVITWLIPIAIAFIDLSMKDGKPKYDNPITNFIEALIWLI